MVRLLPWTFEPRSSTLGENRGKTLILHPSAICSIGTRVLVAVLGDGVQAAGGNAGSGVLGWRMSSWWGCCRCWVLVAPVRPWFSPLPFCLQVMLAASYWSLLAPAIDLAEESGAFGAFAFLPVAAGFILGAAFVYFADLLIPALVSDRSRALPSPLL